MQCNRAGAYAVRRTSLASESLFFFFSFLKDLYYLRVSGQSGTGLSTRLGFPSKEPKTSVHHMCVLTIICVLVQTSNSGLAHWKHITRIC